MPFAPSDLSKLKGARKADELPRFVKPQLATLADDAPLGEDWSHEVKFDGYRAILRVEDGKAEIRSRNDKDWTTAYGVLTDQAVKLPVQSAILDGEVVAQSPDGTTSFEALRHLARVPATTAPASAGQDSGQRPRLAGRLVYYAFDLLFLNGFDLLGAPLGERRALLREVLAGDETDGRIRFSDHLVGDGPTVLRQACEIGLEGVVSKRTDSRYHPGERGPEWIKAKCRQEQEFVIGGFTDPKGTRTGFGALLLGVYADEGLRYVSKVGTGFDDRELRDLGARLRALETDQTPFRGGPPTTDASVHWVRPDLVAQVSFMEWTSTGGIRHASFKSLREDKPASEVVAETLEGDHLHA